MAPCKLTTSAKFLLKEVHNFLLLPTIQVSNSLLAQAVYFYAFHLSQLFYKHVYGFDTNLKWDHY